MTAPTTSRDLTCSECGTAFGCSGDAACWCAAEPYRLRMTDIDKQRDCLCPSCLRGLLQRKTNILPSLVAECSEFNTRAV